MTAEPHTEESTDDTAPSAGTPWLRVAVDLGPLLTFFGLYFLISPEKAEAIVKAGDVSRLILATVGYMILSTLALGVAYWKQGRIAPMPLVTGVIVLVFGGLTVILQDDTFIKMKPTMINGLFATILFGGLATNRPFMKVLFGEVFQLTDAGWRTLTIRWGLFFIFLGILNEVVWRNFSEEFWVSFKVFGVLPLTMIFGALQMPLLSKHAPPENASEKP